MLLKGRAFKDNNLYDMAFSQFGRFLSLPTLLNGALCLIPLVFDEMSPLDRDEKTAAIVALVFNLLCLIGFILIYVKLPKCGGSIPTFVFKKGFISTCIAYHIYFFFNNIITIAYFDDPLGIKAEDRRTGSWICILLFGIIIGLFTWFFQDVVVGLMGFLFNVAFFVLSSADKPRKELGNRNDGNYACSIICFIALAVEVGALIAIKKKEVLQ